MLQYYLRRHGLALSWVGTGRMMFSLNYSSENFAEVARRFVAAAEAMAHDGWWWQADAAEKGRPSIKRQILNEMLYHAVSGLVGARRSPTP